MTPAACEIAGRNSEELRFEMETRRDVVRLAVVTLAIAVAVMVAAPLAFAAVAPVAGTARPAGINVGAGLCSAPAPPSHGG